MALGFAGFLCPKFCVDGDRFLLPDTFRKQERDAWSSPDYWAVSKLHCPIESHQFTAAIIGVNGVYDDFMVVVNKPGDLPSKEQGQVRIEVVMPRALGVVAPTVRCLWRLRAATLPEDFQGCFYQRFKSHQSSGAPDGTPGSVTNDTEVWHDQLFERLKTRDPNLMLIDQRLAQCSGDSGTTIYKVCRSIGTRTHVR
jgi:hypothetical protein